MYAGIAGYTNIDRLVVLKARLKYGRVCHGDGVLLY